MLMLNDPRMRWLAVGLGQPLYAALGLVELLGLLAASAPEGDLGQVPPMAIAAALALDSSEPDYILELLVSSGWLRKEDDGSLRLADYVTELRVNDADFAGALATSGFNRERVNDSGCVDSLTDIVTCERVNDSDSVTSTADLLTGERVNDSDFVSDTTNIESNGERVNNSGTAVALADHGNAVINTLDCDTSDVTIDRVNDSGCVDALTDPLNFERVNNCDEKSLSTPPYPPSCSKFPESGTNTLGRKGGMERCGEEGREGTPLCGLLTLFPEIPADGILKPARCKKAKRPATAPGAQSIDEFWNRLREAYPPRAGQLEVAKAREKFARLLERGEDPEAIILGAVNYRRWAEAVEVINTPYVTMLTTWLNRRRWAEEYVIPKTFIAPGSEELRRRLDAARGRSG